MVLSSVGTWTRRNLPRGDGLADALWARRHRAVVGVLWTTGATLVTVGLAQGDGVGHLALEAAAIVVAGALASTGVMGRRSRSAAATFGVLTCAALLVHLWDGAVEAHFAFFVVVPLVTLYHEWMPVGLALGYVFVHHLVFATTEPERAFDRDGALDHPLGWALVHTGFVLLSTIAAIAAWRADEHAGELAEAERRAAVEADVRRRHALDVHDDVVQRLVVARLALDLDDDESARRAIGGALAAARAVVGELLDDDRITDLTRERATTSTMATEASLPTVGPASPGRRGVRP
jgi:signal transduction histidine kinase